MATRRVFRSGRGPTRFNRQQISVSGLYELQKRKTKRCNQVCRLPGGANPYHPPQDQAQIEGCRMDQHTLGDVVLTSQVYSPHATGVVQMSEASFDQFPAPFDRFLAALGVHPPPLPLYRPLPRPPPAPLL